MTVTARPTTSRTVHDPTRRHSLAGGLFYLLTFAASIPAWVLIRSSVSGDLTLIPGHETQLLWAGVGDWVTASVTSNGIGAQVWIQLKAVLLTIVWSGVVSVIAFKITDLVVGLRVTEEEEREGLDISAHGETAYHA